MQTRPCVFALLDELKAQAAFHSPSLPANTHLNRPVPKLTAETFGLDSQALVQVIGRNEQKHLLDLDTEHRRAEVNKLTDRGTLLIVFSDDVPADLLFPDANNPPDCLAYLSTDKSVEHAKSCIQAALAKQYGEKLTLHGVFMQICGLGTLLLGTPGIGKSELALELVTRGHQLIADDAPTFTRTSVSQLSGECPSLLQDFLEVRGLGVLNIRQLYGDKAIKLSQNLDLIVRLSTEDSAGLSQRCQRHDTTHTVLGISIPETSIPASPGRNLAVLVEATVRNHAARARGYDSNQAFCERLQAHMEIESS